MFFPSVRPAEEAPHLEKLVINRKRQSTTTYEHRLDLIEADQKVQIPPTWRDQARQITLLVCY
jgi:hypothetical protein